MKLVEKTYYNMIIRIEETHVKILGTVIYVSQEDVCFYLKYEDFQFSEWIYLL